MTNHLRSARSRWTWRINEEEAIDPLVRMAAAHYQFEAIHPFTDGNGRTGRVLNSLFLVEQSAAAADSLQPYFGTW